MSNVVLRLKWILDLRCVRSFQVLDQNYRGTVVVLLNLLIVNKDINKCGDSSKKKNKGINRFLPLSWTVMKNRFTVFILATAGLLRLCSSLVGYDRLISFLPCIVLSLLALLLGSQPLFSTANITWS